MIWGFFFSTEKFIGWVLLLVCAVWPLSLFHVFVYLRGEGFSTLQTYLSFLGSEALVVADLAELTLLNMVYKATIHKIKEAYWGADFSRSRFPLAQMLKPTPKGIVCTHQACSIVPKKVVCWKRRGEALFFWMYHWACVLTCISTSGGCVADMTASLAIVSGRAGWCFHFFIY